MSVDACPIGIIGGSGLYGMEELEVHEERAIATPFGSPSEVFVLGELRGRPVAFLARHGRGHRILPSELNFRANIYAFKSLGVERLISLSAVGSLRRRYQPTHIVVPDQFIDRTRHRPDTFFGNGLAAHVAFADPICPLLMEVCADQAAAAGAVVHRGGVYVCMEGPQFSTRAESFMHRSWGADVIGMTNLQEAKLAREAEICYATLALITDYDCWHEEEEDVTVEAVLAVLRQNARTAQAAVARIVESLPGERRSGACPCVNALEHALITDPAVVPASVLRDLAPIVGRLLGDGGNR
ncbi:MAG: S-methyl-5'-thioadenosine phosphorylase [Holophagales bacterium]|nr:S-methyl-5'-thioadenosine phosphorylase [Holophagales bacterium]MYG29224.1 S-methyl-5'-thioadenosine phosphorylase [Holophagales bacterium]MYI81206.1 S-methyl-5'-thioadenosine phosphorylase [Holophagales bacterium]